jgi:hypothetical protein
MNNKNSSAIKLAATFVATSAALIAAASFVVKKRADASNQRGVDEDAEPRLLIDDAIPVSGPSSPPIAAGGGGIVFGQPSPTVVLPNSGIVISKDPVVAIEQIRVLAETAGGTQGGSPNVAGVKEQTVTTTDASGTRVQKVFVTADGRNLTEQQVLDEFIKTSFDPVVRQDLEEGRNKSVLQSLFDGSPINVTNFVTERPVGFPEAKADTAFLRRAQALKPTLTVGNPGGSSAAAVPNFSRLAAVGTDLSKVDLFGVQNPNFLGSIKTGQPLTERDRQLIAEQRAKTDPRNMTRAELDSVRKNAQSRIVEKGQIDARANSLSAAGFNEASAKAFLKSKGFNVTGSLTAAQFAALERKL